MSGIYVKDGGLWKPVKAMHIKDAGAWKDVKQAYVKHAGQWSPLFETISPIVLNYNGKIAYRNGFNWAIDTSLQSINNWSWTSLFTSRDGTLFAFNQDGQIAKKDSVGWGLYSTISLSGSWSSVCFLVNGDLAAIDFGGSVAVLSSDGWSVVASLSNIASRGWSSISHSYYDGYIYALNTNGKIGVRPGATAYSNWHEGVSLSSISGNDWALLEHNQNTDQLFALNSWIGKIGLYVGGGWTEYASLDASKRYWRSIAHDANGLMWALNDRGQILSKTPDGFDEEFSLQTLGSGWYSMKFLPADYTPGRQTNQSPRLSL